MSTSIDWTEIIKDRKGVVTKDNQSCGNIIGEDEENIVIEDGAISQHFYRIPKSAVGGYNGAELTLNMQYNELETYEEKEKDKGKEGSITESIKNKVTSLKEKTVDKATDTNDKDEYKSERSSDIGHADNVKYQSTGEIRGQNESRARSSYAQTSANTDTGKMSDETSANIDTTFTCETCDTKFTSRQELKEHSAAEH